MSNLDQNDSRTAQADCTQNAVLELSKTLIAQASITPDDKKCQNILADRLQSSGFVSEFLYYGDKNATDHTAQVKNLWARRGQSSPLLCFAGHTDVVPTGDIKNWTHPPFEPTVQDGFLWGRGAADMKTGIAAFVVAVENFVKKYPEHKGSIALLITADEEGASINGTAKVVQTLQDRHEKIDYCLVGEPSSSQQLGDIIKNGRRGSLGGILTVTGKQGHVAYPHLAINPIHFALPALTELSQTQWDTGNDHFPATSFQISNLNAGTGANNVIPKTLTAEFNFRFSTETTAEQLKTQTHAIFDKHFANQTSEPKAHYKIDWKLSGNPFLTEQGELVNACQKAIKRITDTDAQLSTSGGTSDGRFIAPTGAQVVELGVKNATIHQIDERIEITDLGKLAQIYEQILIELLT